MSLLLALLIFLGTLGASPVVLEGHLDSGKLTKAYESLSKTEGSDLFILINSDSGEIEPVLDFAKKIETLDKNIIVYINENAVGPAAILPFAADKLYVSSFVSWGDVYLSTDEKYPINLLRAQVLSLIADENPRKASLDKMAEAMIDADMLLVDEEGLKAYYRSVPTKSPILARKGERLILSQRQLSRFKLIDGVISLQDFKKKYQLPENVEVEETESAAVDDARLPLNERLKRHIEYSPEGKNTVGHIYIGDQKQTINQGTWLYVKQALEYYRKTKPIFIILELNTPGGEVYASQKISDALKEMDTQLGIPIVAVIDNWAISAGVMLAYSSRFITLTKDASMGAAEPILQTTEGMQTASEKINSALRADFANRASFYGRNPLIAEAMVDKDMILVLRGGKFTKLDKEEQIRSSDIVVSAKGKLLTLNANQIMEYGVGDIKMEPTKRPLITTDERSAGKWPANKMLLFHQPFFKSIPNATIDSYKPDWKTSILTYLASPIVASALFMGLLIGFYVEFNTPGFGLPGAIGLTCLFLIILSSYSIDAVNWLELILIGIGVALILVDLFLIPSFGIVGGLGILLALGGLFALMIPGLENIDYEFDTGTFNAAGEYALRRLAWLSGGFIVSLVIVGLLARYLFPLLAPYSRFVLAGSEQTGYTAGISVQELPAVGSRAEALTDLRPTGKIEFEGKEFEAMSEGSYIEKGSALRVTRHEGNVLYVERDV